MRGGNNVLAAYREHTKPDHNIKTLEKKCKIQDGLKGTTVSPGLLSSNKYLKPTKNIRTKSRSTLRTLYRCIKRRQAVGASFNNMLEIITNLSISSPEHFPRHSEWLGYY
ncbi:hypothetical protein J6590_062784 [Homalodisca vitripennis]|nr:hypothetical protein J6590_062784 [Homalodisca vitripennis]